jgi:hypothetical protein
MCLIEKTLHIQSRTTAVPSVVAPRAQRLPVRAPSDILILRSAKMPSATASTGAQIIATNNIHGGLSKSKAATGESAKIMATNPIRHVR